MYFFWPFTGANSSLLALPNQARSQEIALGERAVLEAGYNFKGSWPRFWLLFTQIASFVLSKFRCSPKKKGLHRNWDGFSVRIQVISKKVRSSFRLKPSFCAEYHFRFLTNSHHQNRWGAIFVFSAKIGLKNAKNRVFCILFKPIGGSSPPCPLPGYAIRPNWKIEPYILAPQATLKWNCLSRHKTNPFFRLLSSGFKSSCELFSAQNSDFNFTCPPQKCLT